jgi:hypothetical protein
MIADDAGANLIDLACQRSCLLISFEEAAVTRMREQAVVMPCLSICSSDAAGVQPLAGPPVISGVWK